MVLEPVLCSDCGSDDGVKPSRSGAGKQRYTKLNQSSYRSDKLKGVKVRSNDGWSERDCNQRKS